MNNTTRLLRFARECPAWLLTTLVSGAILYLTLFPKPLGDNQIRLFDGADKVVHAIMFGALYCAVVIDLWLRRHRRGLADGSFVGWPTACWVAVIASVAGGLIEVLQYAMGLGRGMELADWAADTIGVSVCMIVSLRIGRGRP